MSNPTLQDRLAADLMAARKAQDKLRVMVLGTTISEMKNKRIELGRDLTDDDGVAVLGKALKRRSEAAEQMRAGGHEELAAKEDAEAAILGCYLPQAMPESEVRTLVQAAIDGGATRMGDVMKIVSPRTRGRFDGKALSGIVQSMLG